MKGQLLARTLKRVENIRKVYSLLGFVWITNLCLMSTINAADRYAVASGYWNATSTWSASDQGTPGASVPVAGDNVFITRGWTVTVNINNAACGALRLGKVGGTTAATGTLTFTNTGSPSLTVSGSIILGGTSSNSGSTGTITFTSGSNLSGGSLVIGGSNGPNTGIVTMTAGGDFTINGAITIGADGGTWTPGAGTVILTGNNTLPNSVVTTFNDLSINSNTTNLGVNTVVNGTLALTGILNVNSFTASSGDLTGNGILTNTGAADIFTIGAANTSTTFSGAINGALSLTKTGTGVLTLSGSGSYSGATTINAGTLSINSMVNSGTNSAIGTGSTTSTISIAGGATLHYTGPATSSNRVISRTSDGAIIDASGSGTLTLTGASIGGGNNLVLTGTTTGSISGAIGSGNATLTKTGTGTWIMSGTNTYTGGTFISGGTLSVGADANLGTGSITFSNGAILKTTGTYSSTAKAITLNSGGGTFDLTPPLMLTGTISGGGGLYTGGSDLILNRASGNNNIGTINLNSNRLFVFAGLNNINGSAINVAAGAILDFSIGTTTPTNTIVFASGSCLANRVGTLTVNTANVTFPSSGTMIFNYDDQITTPIVVNGNYPTLTGNLTVQTGGLNTTVGNTTMNGTMGGGFNLNKTSNGTLIFGSATLNLDDLTISTGTLTSTAGTMNLAGDFNNNGIFNHNNGVVNFNGGTAQSIGGSVTATFNDLTLNSAGLTLNQDATVNGDLVFNAGLVNTSTTNILSLGTAATASGGTTGSHINGPMEKSGSIDFEFPIGNATLYRPVSILNLSSAANIRAQYFLANPKTVFGAAMGTGLQQLSVCEYWDIDDGAATITARVELNFGGSCNGAPYVTDAPSLRVAHWNGTQWDNLGNASSTLTSVEGNLTSTFSPFTIGTTNGALNPVPVKFSSIKAYEKASGVQIDWTSYQEENLANYVIERSANGSSFTTIGSVAATGSISITNYSFYDASPLPGVSYYRIKPVDIDIRFSYSNIVKVDLDKSNTSFNLYPNPVISGAVSIQSSELRKGNYAVRVFSALGQEVYSQRFSHSGGAINQTIHLPVNVHSGIYSIQLESDGVKIINKKFIVQ